MIPVPSGVRVWLAVGHTDMRRGMNSLALQVQEGLKRDSHAGDLSRFCELYRNWASRLSVTMRQAHIESRAGSSLTPPASRPCDRHHAPERHRPYQHR